VGLPPGKKNYRAVRRPHEASAVGFQIFCIEMALSTFFVIEMALRIFCYYRCYEQSWLTKIFTFRALDDYRGIVNATDLFLASIDFVRLLFKILNYFLWRVITLFVVLKGWRLLRGIRLIASLELVVIKGGIASSRLYSAVYQVSMKSVDSLEVFVDHCLLRLRGTTFDEQIFELRHLSLCNTKNDSEVENIRETDKAKGGTSQRSMMSVGAGFSMRRLRLGQTISWILDNEGEYKRLLHEPFMHVHKCLSITQLCIHERSNDGDERFLLKPVNSITLDIRAQRRLADHALLKIETVVKIPQFEFCLAKQPSSPPTALKLKFISLETMKTNVDFWEQSLSIANAISL